MFSFRSFMISGFAFKPSVHFELVFMYSVRQWSNFTSFAHGRPGFPPSFIEQTVLSELCVLGSFVIK